MLHPDRYFPLDEKAKSMARELYLTVKELPIVSPHGHTDPLWFVENSGFNDPVSVFLTPDHYVLRMLYSQGISMPALGVSPLEGSAAMKPAREIWHLFAKNYFLFRGTPSSLWLNHVFHDVFGLEKPLSPETADIYFDTIQSKLNTPEYKPRALFDRFKIEVLATTDAPTDTLDSHRKIKTDWPRRIIPTYRPDSCVDPEHVRFFDAVRELGEITGEDTLNLAGYLRAHRVRREQFKTLGATATDHGHPSPKTLSLSISDAQNLFERIMARKSSAADAENFRAYMLFEMARMSLDDGLVMQLHPGTLRNHNAELYAKFGPDKGADIPTTAEYTRNLKPLLDAFGNDPRLTLILFTLDETVYSRELAPLAGHYPSLKLGPPWWFHDSAEGMIRFREQATETAGFYNTVGFIDDTRAFFSIPARHDLARRIDCRMLATWVCEHRMDEKSAFEVIKDLSYNLVKKAYRL